jgi:hypothetical protein
MAAPESEVRTAVEGFAATWRRVTTDPQGFFADMPETGGLAAPLTFLAACAAINAVAHLLVLVGLGGMIAVFVGQLIGAFVAATVFVIVAQHLFEGRAGFEPTFRVVAYASAPTVFSWIPVLGVLAWLYAAYLTVRGLERVHRMDATRAVLTVAIGFGVVVLLGVAIGRHPHL